MSIVIDASVTLAWLFADETSPAADRILDRVVANGAWVPSIWRLEVANSLHQGMRRGRLDATRWDQSLADLRSLDIALDPETDRHAWSDTLALAERFNLTVYDAAYLELALRRSVPLATLDGELRAVARKAGAEVADG